MSPKRLIAIAALALTGAAVPAVAHAQGGDDPTAGGPPREIIGAYAFKDSWPPRNKPLITVVFKLNGQLPRRFDGLIRASAGLDGSGGSIGSVGGRATRIYQFNVPTLNGRLRADGSPSARIGSHAHPARRGPRRLLVGHVHRADPRSSAHSRPCATASRTHRRAPLAVRWPRTSSRHCTSTTTPYLGEVAGRGEEVLAVLGLGRLHAHVAARRPLFARSRTGLRHRAGAADRVGERVVHRARREEDEVGAHA